MILFLVGMVVGFISCYLLYLPSMSEIKRYEQTVKEAEMLIESLRDERESRKKNNEGGFKAHA